MEDASLDNDTRGWIMCLVSGVACVVGASVICIDSFVHLFPWGRGFQIHKSNAFLASSLALSFGVMLFSSLYSMLPTAREYFRMAGYAPQDAGYLLMAGFATGFVGIQIISRICHQFMPSHVVDCDHTHAGGHSHSAHEHSHSHSDSHKSAPEDAPKSAWNGTIPEGENEEASESTPLLKTQVRQKGRPATHRSRSYQNDARPSKNRTHETQDVRRPSLVTVPQRVMSFVKDTKCNCGETGTCYGYTDPCGQECFKHQNRSLLRTTASTALLSQPVQEPAGPSRPELLSRPSYHTTLTHSHPSSSATLSADHSHTHQGPSEDDDCSSMTADVEAQDSPQQHHHHVPTNAFLSIGLQTSIAIAVHKFPEGFITYASNHANPQLGFNVFMALFVHNISEGFAMALPLYMALRSRLRAMLWASLLGGFSQPLGAGIAVLWFRITKGSTLKMNNTLYAFLFAITAGIMCSVALQLFVESLSLNHSRNLCIFFAFLGMTILGLSNALTAH